LGSGAGGGGGCGRKNNETIAGGVIEQNCAKIQSINESKSGKYAWKSKVPDQNIWNDVDFEGLALVKTCIVCG
jgi:hypothetical protein